MRALLYSQKIMMEQKQLKILFLLLRVLHFVKLQLGARAPAQTTSYIVVPGLVAFEQRGCAPLVSL